MQNTCYCVLGDAIDTPRYALCHSAEMEAMLNGGDGPEPEPEEDSDADDGIGDAEDDDFALLESMLNG